MVKKMGLFILAAAFLIVAAYLVGVLHNNRDLAYPSQQKIQKQLEQSVQWLVNNESEILSQNNPMLWWMLYESQQISKDKRLAELLEKYYQKNRGIKYSPWGPLFAGAQQSRLDAYSVLGLPYYNQHFIYALNCAPQIEEGLEIVAQQNTKDFCHQLGYIYRPACSTHQLMGINFLLSQQCNLLANVAEVKASLQQDIIQQLTWDIRVVDIYLQRVLMLLITGAESSIKPVWLQQVLDHQLQDGGWSAFQRLIGTQQRALGFSSRIISFGREQSSFHATAQGVYILSYMLDK